MPGDDRGALSLGYPWGLAVGALCAAAVRAVRGVLERWLTRLSAWRAGVGRAEVTGGGRSYQTGAAPIHATPVSGGSFELEDYRPDLTIVPADARLTAMFKSLAVEVV